MKPPKKLDIHAIQDELTSRLVVIRRYSIVIFVVLVAVLYGFLFFRVNTLTNAQPSSDAVDSQVKAAKIPHINPAIVQQLQSLQDNSVNVQTLFNQARNNPFQ